MGTVPFFQEYLHYPAEAKFKDIVAATCSLSVSAECNNGSELIFWAVSIGIASSHFTLWEGAYVQMLLNRTWHNKLTLTPFLFSFSV